MEKRIFLAVVISIALLAAWSAVMPRLFPELARKPEPPAPAATKAGAGKPGAPAPAPGTASAARPPAATTAAARPAPVTPVAATRLQTSTIDTHEYTAVFSNRGAQLVSFRLKNYKRQDDPKRIVDLVRTRDARRSDFPFQIETGDRVLAQRVNTALYDVTDRTSGNVRTIEYRFSDGRHAVTKTFAFDLTRPYLFDFSTTVTPPVGYRVAIGPGIRTIGPREVDSAAVFTGNGVVQTEGEFEVIGRESGDRLQPFPQIDYIGIEDNYFLTVLRPKIGEGGLLVRRTLTDPATKSERADYYAAVNGNADGVVNGNAFFGPKETTLLDAYGLEAALQFGWFDIIARFFLTALVWLNQFTKNYGFAIIVLTIIIKIVLYPLQHKSTVSMKKMQRVQPKVEAIRARYKKSRTDADQRNRMNQEMMQLYQKEGINPMAGCLPLLLQLPILWGFYNLLSRAIELRGAPWILWIRDLSEKDPTYILPILMTATMFLQTYLTPATGDPAQRKIFLIMPLVFGFLFKDFPSGLVLYWLVQNILTIIQQLIMNKWWKDHPEPSAPATT